MQSFREYYEIGTDAYTKHTKKMTPGQIQASHCGSKKKVNEGEGKYKGET